VRTRRQRTAVRRLGAGARGRGHQILLILTFILAGYRLAFGSLGFVSSLKMSRESAEATMKRASNPFGLHHSEQAAAQIAEATAKLVDLQLELRPFALGLGLLELPLAVLLLASARGTRRRQERSRKLLRTACLVSTPLQVVAMAVGAFTLSRTIGPTLASSTAMLAGAPGAELATAVTRAALLTGFVGGMLLNVGLIAFFVFFARRLDAPDVCAQFGAAAWSR